MPKACANELQSSSELAGRRAGGRIVGGGDRDDLGVAPLSGACAATMRLAKPCQVVTPVPAKW